MKPSLREQRARDSLYAAYVYGYASRRYVELDRLRQAATRAHSKGGVDAAVANYVAALHATCALRSDSSTSKRRKRPVAKTTKPAMEMGKAA